MKAGWQTKPLGDVVSIIKTQHRNEKPLPYVGMEDIASETGLYLGSLEPKKVKGGSFRFNDQHVLYGRLRPYLNKVLLPDFEGHCSTEVFPLQPTTELDKRFLFYWLTHSPTVELINSTCTGARMPRANMNGVLELDFSYPPLPEQQRLVTILDDAFEGIATATANAEKNLSNARELFDSYLQNVKAQQEEIGEYVNITTGKLDSNAAREGGRYPFFTCSKQVFAIDHFAFDSEAILLAGNNASGDFNVKHYKGKFNAYQRTYVITIRDEAKLLYRYLYFQMLNSLKSFKRQAVGANTKFLKLPMIKGLQIPLPSISEQRSIVSTLDNLSTETKQLEGIYQQKLTAFNELKKSILHQAFTGQLH